MKVSELKSQKQSPMTGKDCCNNNVITTGRLPEIVGIIANEKAEQGKAQASASRASQASLLAISLSCASSLLAFGLLSFISFINQKNEHATYRNTCQSAKLMNKNVTQVP